MFAECQYVFLGFVRYAAQVSRCSICDFLGTWDAHGRPPRGGLHRGGVVLVGGGNENWGMFSEHVVDRSVAWGSFANKLKSCGKTVADFQVPPVARPSHKPTQ